MSMLGGPAPSATDMRHETMLKSRSPVMQIDFVKSGGFGFPLRKAIKATIKLKSDGAEVSSDAAYHRTLPLDEAEHLRVGADPLELDKAATQIARNQRAGAADLDHYHITITTKDGKSHDVTLNTSLASNELDGVSPAVVKFLRWIQDEAKKIRNQSVSGQ
jgi:hypothetical protein